VAGEVKALAAQTAKATEEISQQIQSLRGATIAAVTAVEEIGRTLDDVAHVSVSVAAAIEEQNAATQEIARNVAESGSAVQEVTVRIAEVSGEVKTTGDQATQLRSTSGKVAGDIAVLRGALVRTVRTATTEADRRLETRAGIQEPCTVRFGADATSVAGTVCDISHGGAAIVIAGDGGAAGAVGTLSLDRHGATQVQFAIRTVDAGGRIHIAFTAKDAGFERALETLLPSVPEARRA
jgi:aerotaxis receptor